MGLAMTVLDLPISSGFNHVLSVILAYASRIDDKLGMLLDHWVIEYIVIGGYSGRGSRT